MTKAITKPKRFDLLYLIGAIGCGGLLYVGYTWYYKTTEQANVPESRAHQIQNANSAFAQGNIFYKEGKFTEAIASYHTALEIQPQHEQSHISTALASAKLGNYDHAITHAKKALDVNKNNPATHLMLGQFHEQKKDYTLAKTAYHASLQLNPNFSEAHYFLTRLYTKEGTKQSTDLAIQHGQKAIALQPDSKNAYMGLGDAYLFAGKPTHAREQFQKVLALNPQADDALIATGKTYERSHMANDAATYYQEAIRLNPNNPHAHVSLAGMYFSKGQLQRGFEEYEWRWHLTNQPNLRNSRWDGLEPKDKKILVLAENGLGDIIQYTRFAKTLKEKGATVIVHAPKSLVKLFANCDYIDEVIPAGTPNPAFDAFTSMQSIPHLFKISEQNLPNKPYLFADKKLVKEWAEKLSSDTKFKVGIIWQPGDDSYLGLDQKRAIDISLFAPLSKLDNVSFYSLQMGGNTKEQIQNAPFKIVDFGESFDKDNGPFMDTAAVMKNMDLVVSVDTSVAHLAGALGVKTWILLPYGSDVRWELEKSNSIWYPSVTLFRQEKIEQWNTVISNVSHKLKQLIEAKNKA